MIDLVNFPIPQTVTSIKKRSEDLNFTMASDWFTGSLLRTLAATKPGGRFLDIGTGTGLSSAWILEGMDESSSLITIDTAEELLNVAKEFLGNDPRIKIIKEDGEIFLKEYKGEKFDLIFADAYPGKYNTLDEALNLVKKGGLYIIDDLSPQPNWPSDHAPKVPILIEYLESRADFVLTKLQWSTGIIIATKVKN